ncbi:MAG: response regulator [Planctomycetota bacterium]
MTIAANDAGADPSADLAENRLRMLVVDDDEMFRTRLVRAMSNRGLETASAADADGAEKAAREFKPDWASVDLRMPGRGGLELVKSLHAIDGDMQIVVLTGYGTIATAVEAVKLGAADYLTKPVDADQILASFEAAEAKAADRPLPNLPRIKAAEAQMPSLARVEWDYIHRVLSDCNGNISQAARKLGIHRRSLQRKLHKLPPLE